MSESLVTLSMAFSSQSNSSVAGVGTAQKLREAFTYLRWRLASREGPRQFDPIFEQMDGYRRAYERMTARPFGDARVLEIGFGARPLRLIAMMSMWNDVRGIDLDMPMLRFSLPSLVHIVRTNGPERMLKTAVRGLLFDPRERANLRLALKMRGHELRIELARFIVGNAATYDYGTAPIDFVYSEDVFEHIPLQDLEMLVARLARHMSADGLALITPNIFTGITGGHLPEWYSHAVGNNTAKRSEPWEHLRKSRYTANTYLNRLPRSSYRELFGRHFEILEEIEIQPNLGRQWLTPGVREELAVWQEDELFSNKVQFVLRPRKVLHGN